MIDPEYMCDKHILGEHGELHKHRHIFEKQHSISGRIDPIVQIEPMFLKQRHDALVEEMEARGMNHDSPFAWVNVSYLPHSERMAQVDMEYNIQDLADRCPACAELLQDIM